MTLKPLAAAFLIGCTALAGCSTPTPSPIQAEPKFDKLGQAIGCRDGMVLVTSANYPATCVPDTGDCDEKPHYNAHGNIVDPCPIPRDPRDRNPSRGPDVQDIQDVQ